MNYGDINTLVQINNSLEKADMEADKARVHNPTREVRDALASFLTARLNRIEDDANFSDLIRATIKSRIEEATFSELTELLHITTMDNNRAAEGISSLFVNESSGRTVVDTLQSNDTETVAQQLYASTNDKNTLQALTYFGAVLAKLTADQPNIVEVPASETN